MCFKICLLFFMNLISMHGLFGEIRNGYQHEIHGMRQSLKRLTSLIQEDENLSLEQRGRIKNHIERLVEEMHYYELTEALLRQFHLISPGLYEEIAAIMNDKGEPVHVYVKFVSERQMQHGAFGTTNLACADHDRSVYLSEFGVNTV